MYRNDLISKNQNLAETLEFQRKAVASLKREIFGTDKKPKSKYIKDFVAEFSRFDRIARYEELLDQASQSRIVFVGDYHALPSCQEFQARFLEDLAHRPIVLALEMFYGRNQHALDDWLSGTIDDACLLRRVQFELEWGYDWESYRKILEVARRLGIPVFAVDCAPRDDFRLIAKRDAAVAAKISNIVQTYPDRTVVVCFGESHLAANHLPSKVEAHFENRPVRMLTVLQNVDEVYWKIASIGCEDARVVKLKEDAYCVFNATPFEKYERYRRQLEIWDAQDDDEHFDLTSTIHNLIDTIVSFTRIDQYRYCLTREGVCIEFLVDAYPEVYSLNEFDDFESLLRTGHIKKAQVHEVINHTMHRGSCYVPRVNAIFIGNFNLIHGAEEAAHFVNFALKRQRFEQYRPNPLMLVDEFYLRVLEEALGYFGSKLIDPRRNQLEESFVLNYQRLEMSFKSMLGISSRSLNWMRRFVISHKMVEREYGSMKRLPPIFSRGLRAQGRAFTILTHELGYLLGEQLYRGYVAGIFSRREMSLLFQRRFEDEGRPLEAYLELTDRATPLDL